MLVTRQKILRRFWYPVIPLDTLDDGPQPFTLLGEKIVVWRAADGEPAVAMDRCCHRSAALSRGWVEDGNLVCGYHGWTYDRDGRVVRVPQQKDPSRGNRHRVRTFDAAARYGYVWVCLDAPLGDIPLYEEAEMPGYRMIQQFYERWQCAGLRLMENSFDMAHISFVHRKSFGLAENPEVRELDIEHNDAGFVMRAEHPVAGNDIAKKSPLRNTDEATVRTITSTWFMPFARKLHIRYPNGLVHVIATIATPIDDGASQIVQFAMRNDTEAQTPAADVIAFDRQVTLEDQYILESTDPDVPLDLQAGAEGHMPSDRPGMEMRKRLAALLAAHGEVEATDAYARDPGLAAE